MSERVSAGLLLYRVRERGLEVVLAHPGGPLFVHKDDGHWSIPKGEIHPGEDLLETAIREVHEEVGARIDPASRFIPLGSIRQKGGKLVHAWGVESDWDDSVKFTSNTFRLEWPPHSGQVQYFPEIDRAQFFPLADAVKKIKATQIPLLERLAEALSR